MFKEYKPTYRDWIPVPKRELRAVWAVMFAYDDGAPPVWTVWNGLVYDDKTTALTKLAHARDVEPDLMFKLVELEASITI